MHTEDIERWLVAAGPYTPETRTTFLVHLHAFYSWAVTEGLIAANPVVPLRCPRRSLSDALAVDPKATSSDGQLTLEQLGRMYINARIRRGEIKDLTARNSVCALEGLARVYGDALVSSLSQEHIEDWMATIGVLAPATRRSRLSCIKGFCQWLARRKFIPTDPTVEIQRVRMPRYLPRGLPAPAAASLLRTCPDTRAELIVLLQVQEGLRCAEVAHLQLSDVDFIDRTMRIVGKGDHVRLLPLTEETWEVLQRYLADTRLTAGPLLRSKRSPSDGLQPGSVSKMIGEWMSDAGLKRHSRDGVSAHALRHSAATDMLRAGAHLRDVQAALGHTSLSTTQRYLPTVVHDLQTAMGGRRYRG